MESLLNDLRYAVRTLGRTPGFTLAAVCALALGIGGSAAIFSVMHGIVLKPLPIPEADRLVAVSEASQHAEKNDPGFPFAPGNYVDVAASVRSFESMAGYVPFDMNLVDAEGPETLPIGLVTSSFLTTLRTAPAMGRNFTEAEDDEAHARVVLLGDALWRRRFHANPSVVGRAVSLGGFPFTIIGVLPPDFDFPGLRRATPAEALIPFGFSAKDRTNHGSHFIRSIARLKPGVSVDAARAELLALQGTLRARAQDNADLLLTARSYQELLVRRVKPALQALFCAVMLVLLIACANVTNMLLARGATRAREIAIRAALGGSRMRIVQQVLTEAVLLAAVGGAVGLLLASWAIDALVAFAPRDIPRIHEVQMDGAVLLFALAVSLASGLAAGIAPALRASRPDLQSALKDGNQSSTSRGKMREVLVVVEIAIALVLVAGAGIQMRAFERMLNAPMGFDPQGLLTLKISRGPAKNLETAANQAFFRSALERIAALPGVKSVAMTSGVPFGGNQMTLGFLIAGHEAKADGNEAAAPTQVVSAGYFKTLAIPLMRGRVFGPEDRTGTQDAIVVNQAFVRKHFPGEDAIGKRLKMGFQRAIDGEIVGVVGDMRTSSLDEKPQPAIYLSSEQSPAGDSDLVLRVDGDPMRVVPALRAEIQAIDREQSIARVAPLHDLMGSSVAQQRFQMMLLTLFGLVALLLAAVGTYGVMAYTVAQRTREMGVRLALGAQPAQVLELLLRAGLKLAVIGLGVGAALALALTRLAQGMLYGAGTFEPWTVLGLALLLGAVALLATWIPARRATAIDPALALRAE